MENGSIPADLLIVKSVLKKDPSQYSSNSYQRVVGTSIGAKEGDAIKYYKSTTKGKAHFNPSFLSRAKYLEMMKNTFKEQLMVLGYDFMKDVVGMTSLADLI
jgi:hypothetical protein